MSHSTNAAVVRLERSIPAPVHSVFRAWLDPEVLRQWLAPGGLQANRVEVDEEVGGRYRIWHTDKGSDVGGFECEILELVPDERIVFRWGFVGPDRNEGPRYDSLLTITVRKASPGTTMLTLLHERLDELAAAMPQVAANVEHGWQLVLHKLANVFEAPRSSSSPSMSARRA
jgi:uncharacterized protein YndB with AHSA1/START domain